MRGLLFCLLWPGLAQATETLTWRQCVETVTQESAQLNAASETLQATKYLEGVATSGYYPQTSANLSKTHTSTDTPVGNQTTDVYSANLALTQNLFSGFQTSASVSQAQANTRASVADLQIAKAQVSYDFKTSYEGVIYGAEAIDLALDISKRRQENLRLVQLRFQSGAENKASVLLSKAYLLDAQYGELQARDTLEVAYQQLRRTLGFDLTTKFEVKEQVPMQDPPIVSDFQSLATRAPEHDRASAQVDAAKEQVKISRSGFFPNLNLTASAGKTGPEFFPQSDNFMIGLTLSLPLFSGGSSYYATHSSQASLFAASATRENVDQTLLSTLKQAYTAFVEAVEKLKVDSSYREAATLRAEIARSKYNNGLISFDDWDVIENDLILRQRNYLQSKRNRVTAEAAWEQAQGRGVIP